MDNGNYDVVVLGTGPAGLQAAIHASRKKVSVLVLGRTPKSSLFKAHVENYCCQPGFAGQDMLFEGKKQAEAFGAVFMEQDVVGIEPDMGGFTVRLEGGDAVHAKALVLAMGISRHKLKVPGEKELLGKGVSYCVDCDAGFYKGQTVAVVGCESAAASGALTMLFFASEVHLICRELSVTPVLAEKLGEGALHLHLGKWVAEIDGKDKVEALVLDDGSRLPVTGVFIELGAKGAIDLAATLGVQLDPESMQYILADKMQHTNVPGVFAAGDICGPPWQVAKAVGEGCVAGLEAAAFVKRTDGD